MKGAPGGWSGSGPMHAQRSTVDTSTLGGCATVTAHQSDSRFNSLTLTHITELPNYYGQALKPAWPGLKSGPAGKM